MTHRLAMSLAMFVSKNEVLCPQLLQESIDEPILVISSLPITNQNNMYLSRDTFMAFNTLFLKTSNIY